MFDVNVTTCVASFQTNLFIVKPFEEYINPKTVKKPLFATVKVQIYTIQYAKRLAHLHIHKYIFYEDRSRYHTIPQNQLLHSRYTQDPLKYRQ